MEIRDDAGELSWAALENPHVAATPPLKAAL